MMMSKERPLGPGQDTGGAGGVDEVGGDALLSDHAVMLYVHPKNTSFLKEIPPGSQGRAGLVTIAHVTLHGGRGPWDHGPYAHLQELDGQVLQRQEQCIL
jgi:hypothetical protein